MHTPTHKRTLNLTICNTLCCQLSVYFITSSCFPGGSDGQESACNVGDLGSISGLGKLLRRVWQLTPAFLLRECHGQRSLADYWDCTEWETSEQLITARQSLMHCSKHTRRPYLSSLSLCGASMLVVNWLMSEKEFHLFQTSLDDNINICHINLPLPVRLCS